MDLKITVGSKTWIVPQNNIPNLINWLNSNGIDTNRKDLNERMSNQPNMPDTLIME